MENCIFCKELLETTKSQDVFILVSSYLETCDLLWMQCVSICTDGASAMIGSIKRICATRQRNKTCCDNNSLFHPPGSCVRKLLGRIQRKF